MLDFISFVKPAELSKNLDYLVTFSLDNSNYLSYHKLEGMMEKRKMLYQLFKHNLWEKLSPEEIRLYLLLVVTSDQKEGKGRISFNEINRCLSIAFTPDKLKRAISNLKKYNLVKISFFRERDFYFKL